MTVITPDKSFGVGFRHGQIMVRDADGYPKATSVTVPYYGLMIETGKQLNINDPDVRKVTHAAADTVAQYQVLPPNEAASAELQLAGTDFDLDALLTGLKVKTHGESKRMMVNTNKKGFEANVMLLGYQYSTYGESERWRYVIMPSGKIVPRMIGLDDNPEVRTYPIAPFISTKDEFGEPFSVSADGAVKGQFIAGIAAGQPTWCAFLGDGTALTFDFDDDLPAINNTCIVVKIDGAVISSNITYATTGITFGSGHAPAVGKKVCVWYER